MLALLSPPLVTLKQDLSYVLSFATLSLSSTSTLQNQHSGRYPHLLPHPFPYVFFNHTHTTLLGLACYHLCDETFICTEKPVPKTYSVTKHIASHEATHEEFYAHMAEDSHANHVGVTTRSAAAAAVSGIPREWLKHSSRIIACTVDFAFNVLDVPKSPPRKKAHTTACTANNNKLFASILKSLKLHETIMTILIRLDSK